MRLIEEGAYPGAPRVVYRDVRLINLHVCQNDRGLLYEMIHDADLIKYGDGCFGQVHVVRSLRAGTIRAFHRHKRLWEYFCVVRGSAKFCLVNPAGTSGMSLVLSEWRPQLLVIPPGCWHGWMSLTDDVILITTGSQRYNRSTPDEERVSHDHFDDLFENGSPWNDEC